ncbi:MAG: NAD(P)-binding protein, partial [Proteobacteria bacterium]|nr:NAD(P)-binding protein [Pseudomonadota bacterium]
MTSDECMRVLVLGGGPAGLSAAIRLKEKGGRDVDVRLLTQGHLYGGKASTHRDDEGYTWEHG